MLDILPFMLACIPVTYLLNDLAEDPSYIRLIAFIVMPVVYEPVMYCFGGTFGHRAMKIRVRKQSDETKNINIFQSMIWYPLKKSAGMFSVFRWINRKKNLTIIRIKFFS